MGVRSDPVRVWGGSFRVCLRKRMSDATVASDTSQKIGLILSFVASDTENRCSCKQAIKKTSVDRARIDREDPRGLCKFMCT
jgi:hypothetical protein